MPERGFHTETWTDRWFQQLEVDQRYLFIYLWTNEHCNQAGLYQITLPTIAFETKLTIEKLPELLHSLRPKVEWYPDHDLIWVKNFLRRQTKSPKFLVAAANCLKNITNKEVVDVFLQYNHSLSIPYEYTNDRVSIPSTSTSSASAKADLRELSPEENSIIKRLAKLGGWWVEDGDIEWLRDFLADFPDFTVAELKSCVDYHSGRMPSKHKGVWKNRFRHWMRKKREFEAKEPPGPRGKPFEQYMKEQEGS